MKYSNSRINVDVKVSGTTLKFKINEQTEDVLSLIKDKNISVREYSLTSNNYPFYKPSTKKFYLRGKVGERNNEEVTAQFATADEAKAAKEALIEMIEILGDVETNNAIVVQEGAIGDVRTSIIKKSQAKILQLTNNKSYPNTRRDWTQKQAAILDIEEEGIVANVPHYNEHLGQLVDVMNKSTAEVLPTLENGVVNPHKIDSTAARWAVKAVRDLYDAAEVVGPATLIATWRLISGLRGPDLKDATEETGEE